MQYLSDCWYMAGWSSEIDQPAHRGLLARRICDIPVVIFRVNDGLAALVDTCPHRFAPLSRGRLVDGAVQCGYHGLTFGADGRCVHNPHGPIAAAMRVRSFPIVQAHGAIWIWLGEPERADRALLPDLSFFDGSKETAANRDGYLFGKANYLLYVDNLMDLSHVNFLHPAALGTASFVGVRQNIEEDERTLTVRWTRHDLAPAPYEVQAGTYAAEERIDQHTEVQWHPPGSIRLSITAERKDAQANVHHVAHVLTPETSNTVHYFYARTRNFRVDDAEFNRELGSIQDRVFSTEDGPMIEAVQSRMATDDLFALKPLLLRTDEAAVRVRRKLAAMLARQS